MHIRLNDDFLSHFPEASVHTLICEGVERIDEDIAERWKERAKAHVLASGIVPERLVENPEIREWRDAYSQFGLKPSKYRSSIEQLWKRALQGNLIQTPVKLVNLYCYASIIARAPMGGYDLDHIGDSLVLRLSRPGDEFLGIGEKQPWPVPAGAVIYADNTAVICFGWNHRDAACSSLRLNTHRAIFFADSSLKASRARAAAGIALLQEALGDAGCKLVFQTVLDAHKRDVHID
jgi:DNA/RNA-binding domain of Phe-tRNA-synthetase-like protein